AQDTYVKIGTQLAVSRRQCPALLTFVSCAVCARAVCALRRLCPAPFAVLIEVCYLLRDLFPSGGGLSMSERRKTHNGRDLSGKFKVKQTDVEEVRTDPDG